MLRRFWYPALALAFLRQWTNHWQRILGCRKSTRNQLIAATVNDTADTEKGNEYGQLKKEGDSFTIKGLPLDLAIISQASDDNPVAFNYGSTDSSTMKTFFLAEQLEGRKQTV